MRNIFFTLLFWICCLGFAQQTDTVDFLRIEAEVTPNAANGSLNGRAIVQFKMLKDTDVVYLDAVDMKISEVISKRIKVRSQDNRIQFEGQFKPNKTYTVSFNYLATPRQALYFTGDQIWTQGQGKYTSHWLPSLDDMNDKIEFDLTVLAPSKLTVIANGKLFNVDRQGELRRWQFDMEQPMASYLVAFAVGEYSKKSFYSKSGVKIELYFNPKDNAKVEPTYRHTKEIFEFLEEEIGVAYPWQNYKQIPVRDFLYAGMENTTATIFSEAFVTDSIGFNDRNYVNVNAHELAHQWFGNLVTETEGTHHWLQEGFATYYALLAERDVFGEDYYYWKLYNSAEQLQQLSDDGKGEALLNPNASSLTFYEKGNWALHLLKEQIGEAAFKAAVRNYLEKFQFSNVTTNDFLTEVRAVTIINIDKWEADWLVQSAFKAEQAYKYLIRPAFMRSYFELAALGKLPLSEKKMQLLEALTDTNDYIGQEAIYQLANEPIAETIPLYKTGLASGNLYVRQAIATLLNDVPEELQIQYESLLDDASYVTQENALYNLWAGFPEKRQSYLDKMDGVVGFQSKNVRQLWLALALADPIYNNDLKTKFRMELLGYTGSEHSFEIREMAFNYVHELRIWEPTSLRHLVQATTHHNWRFRNAARGLLDELLAVDVYKNILVDMMDVFSEKEKAYLKTKFEGE